MNGINSNFSFKFVDQDQAFKEMKKLDGNKAGQKKSKSIKIIKKNIDIIYYTLYQNFNYSLFFSEFPSKIKEGDIVPRLLTEFGMLVFFTNLSLMELQVRYLALFLLFSVIGGFGWL